WGDRLPQRAPAPLGRRHARRRPASRHQAPERLPRRRLGPPRRFRPGRENRDGLVYRIAICKYGLTLISPMGIELTPSLPIVPHRSRSVLAMTEYTSSISLAQFSSP